VVAVGVAKTGAGYGPGLCVRVKLGKSATGVAAISVGAGISLTGVSVASASVAVNAAVDVDILVGTVVRLGVGVCARRQAASPRLNTSRTGNQRKLYLLNTQTPDRNHRKEQLDLGNRSDPVARSLCSGKV